MLELQHQPISEGFIVMTEAETCESVLGHRSRYVKGLAFGPKLASISKSRQISSQCKVELEKKLSKTQVLMEAQYVTPQNPGVPLTIGQRAEYLWVFHISIPLDRISFTGIHSCIYIFYKNIQIYQNNS